MKKIMLLILIVCLVAVSCIKSPGGHVATVNAPIKSQKYIGKFSENVNIYRKHGDTIEIQREQDESFDVYKLDINKAGMNYEYTAQSGEALLYYKQLSGGNTLEVKRLGNSEEDNILVLKGKTEKNIAKRIGYSDGALVSTSPSERYIIYCAAEAIINQYGLYVYDTQKDSTLQLLGAANEELLNDMEWNISWSQNEEHIVVTSKLIINIPNAAVVGEVNASTMVWSPSGSKIAYIKPDSSGGKTLCTFDIATGSNKEVFVANQDEYLPGYIVWNQNETKLAIVTASSKGDIQTYKAIYSLNLSNKEAKRIDTALQLNETLISQLENMHYNDSGNLLSFTCTASAGSNLHIYNIETSAYEIFYNVEYLHYENNESYVCSSRDKLYFVQGENLIELDKSMNTKVIKNSSVPIDDIYISQDGKAMIVVENVKENLVLRQMVNFSSPI